MMDKYINREELVEWLKRIPLKDLSDGLGLCRVIMEEDFKRAIRTIPDGAIVDLEPVVRCKDCAHRTEMGNCGHPRYHGILPSADPYDFCSYGARMDGGADNETD